MESEKGEQLLSDLIRMDTVGGNEDQIANYIANYLKRYGIDSQLMEVEPHRFNVFAEIGTHQKPILAFTGHQDVVGLGDASSWQHDPFGAEIVGDRMYGRGTSDMKAGLAAEMLAMIKIKQSNVPLNGTIRLLITIGEESSPKNHMQGAQYFAQHGYLDDVSAIIVGEPSSEPISWLKRTKPIDSFNLSNVKIDELVDQNHTSEQYTLNFAHKGSITYKISAVGKTAHSSSPQLGINAIAPIVRVYDDLSAYLRTLHKKNQVLGSTIPVVTKIQGGQQLNSVPSFACLYGKIRTIPEEPNDQIIENIKTIVDKNNHHSHAKLGFLLLGNKLPVPGHADDKLIQILKKHAQKYLSQEVPLGGMPGGTDASEFVKANDHLSVAIFGPGNMTAHQVDEFVDLNNFHRFIKIYQDAALEFLND